MEMSQEHKDALALGRQQSRAIKAYLKTIESRKPGRPVTKESLEQRLSSIAGKIAASDDPLDAVELIQKRIDVEQALAGLEDGANLEELESGFVAHARAYSERKGISYTAWREFGVPASTLRAAGVPETRRR